LNFYYKEKTRRCDSQCNDFVSTFIEW